MQADPREHDEARIASAIESILLVASRPVRMQALARLLGIDSKALDRAVDFLVADQSGRGIRLQIHEGRLQLVTAPENAEVVRDFLQLPRQPKVSRPSMETLSIIAYRQPITRGEIEHVRGVNVDRIIANLEARGWIAEAGRRQSPGRPIEYRTTNGFLELFGMLSLDELPPLASPPESQAAKLTVLGLEASEAE